MNHYELCKKTAEWSLNTSKIVLYEYKSWASIEEPDVLSFDYENNTILYEIKMSRSDFLIDKNKNARKLLQTEKKFSKAYLHHATFSKTGKLICSKWFTYKQQPHLGKKRYYVCPKGLIQPEETGLFGLYWFTGRNFFLKKKSEIFRNDMKKEQNLLIHAVRKLYNNEKSNILSKPIFPHH